jgi:hypothetical protein
MAREASVIVGSGINPLKKDVCINDTTHERHLRGTSTVILNPEDASAGCSGLVTVLTVGGTAVKLPSVALKYRRAITIFNNDNGLEILYIGFDPTLSTGAGFPIQAGSSISMDINGQVVVYGISDGSDIDVRILELS